MAQNNLALMYANGKGVTKNDQQAVAWLRKAAEHGYAGAQNNLGHMYENGTGVPKDDQQAVAWYRKAAEQGNSKAQINLRDLEARLRNEPSDSSTSSKRASSPSSARVPTPGPVAKKRIETMEKVFIGIGAVILIFYIATWLASAYRWVAQGPVFKSESGPLRDAASTAALSPEILAKFNTGTTGKTVPPKAVDSRPSNTVLRPAMESTPTPTEIPRAAPKPEAATNVVARPIQPPAPMQQTTPQTPSRAPEAQSSAVDPDVKMPSPVVNDTKKSVEELRQQVVGELKGMTRTMAVSSAGGITPGPLGWQKGKERDFAAVQTMLASFQRSRIPVSVETAALTGKDQQGKTVTTESFKSITVLLDPIETEIRNGNTDIVNAIQALAALCMTRNESMRIITRRSDAPGIFVKVEGWIGQGFVKGYQSMSTPPLAVVQQPLDSGPGKASFIRIEPRDQTQFAKE